MITKCFLVQAGRRMTDPVGRPFLPIVGRGEGWKGFTRPDGKGRQGSALQNIFVVPAAPPSLALTLLKHP